MCCILKALPELEHLTLEVWHPPLRRYAFHPYQEGKFSI